MVLGSCGSVEYGCCLFTLSCSWYEMTLISRSLCLLADGENGVDLGLVFCTPGGWQRQPSISITLGVESHPIARRYFKFPSMCTKCRASSQPLASFFKPCRREKEEATLRLVVGGILRLYLTTSDYPFRKGPGIFQVVFLNTHAYARLIRGGYDLFAGGQRAVTIS